MLNIYHITLVALLSAVDDNHSGALEDETASYQKELIPINNLYVLSDLNGDGKEDIISEIYFRNGLSYFEVNFGLTRRYAVLGSVTSDNQSRYHSSPLTVNVMDFDADGLPDIVIFEYSREDGIMRAVYRNSGAGSFIQIFNNG